MHPVAGLTSPNLHSCHDRYIVHNWRGSITRDYCTRRQLSRQQFCTFWGSSVWHIDGCVGMAGVLRIHHQCACGYTGRHLCFQQKQTGSKATDGEFVIYHSDQGDTCYWGGTVALATYVEKCWAAWGVRAGVGDQPALLTRNQWLASYTKGTCQVSVLFNHSNTDYTITAPSRTNSWSMQGQWYTFSCSINPLP